MEIAKALGGVGLNIKGYLISKWTRIEIVKQHLQNASTKQQLQKKNDDCKLIWKLIS